MKIRENINVSQVSWIQRGGAVEKYYEPESIEELVSIITDLNRTGSRWDLVGMTSNIYFKESYHIDNLISTKRLNHWEEKDDIIVCDCGVNVQLFSHKMVESGIKGFEGLIDLPGTIGGAVYGNSGCYGNLISDYLLHVDVLLTDGSIKTFQKEDLHFSQRQSDFKRGVLKGTILRVTLRKEFGNKEELKLLAEKYHNMRKATQPGPQNNLGTTYCKFGARTRKGRLLSLLSGLYSRIYRLFVKDEKVCKRKRFELEFKLVGGSSVLPYLFHEGRFIWKDDKADDAFDKYQTIVKKLYTNPQLEIEIRK